MSVVHLVHECLFCSHSFDSAAAKDDHILEHFARETCLECNRDLLRIGDALYTRHDSSTCIKRAVKIEKHTESCYAESFTNHNSQYVDGSNGDDTSTFALNNDDQVKMEQQNTFEDLSEMIDHQKFIPETQRNELDEQAIPVASNKSIANYEANVQVKAEPIEQNVEQSMLVRDQTKPMQFKKNNEIIEKTERNSVRKANHPCLNNSANTSGAQTSVCDICGKTFNHKSSLCKHKLTVHTPAGMIVCKLCSRKFDDHKAHDIHRAECSLKDRLRKSKSVGEFDCDYCQMEFNFKASLRIHIKTKHKPDAEKIQCPLCSIFIKKSSLEAHICSMSNEHPCDMCGKRFKHKSSLCKHRLKAHTPAGMIVCKLCNRKFDDHKAHDIHRAECSLKDRLRKSKSVGEFDCDYCQMKFNFKASLRIHIKTKHKPDAEKIQCPLCSIFIKKSSLEAHICSMSNEHPCDTCGKRFKHKSSLCKHRLKAHTPAGIIVCKLCTRKFDDNEAHDIHKAECALKSRLRWAKRVQAEKIQCSLCSAIFTKSSLETHICPNGIEHSKNRNLSCNICGQSLASRNTLRSHKLWMHSPPGTIFCKVCTRIFPTIDERDQHQAPCKLKKKMRMLRLTGSFECDTCGHVVKTKRDLRMHMIAKHVPDGDKFKCKSCNRLFFQESSVQKHKCKGKDIRHRELITCEACGKIITRGSLYAHRTAFHSPPGTLYCRVCFKVFTNVAELNAHSEECKKRVNTPRQCVICYRILASQRALQRHKISMHSAPGTIFCKTCVKKFETVEELNAHKLECTLKRRLRKIQKQTQMSDGNVK